MQGLVCKYYAFMAFPAVLTADFSMSLVAYLCRIWPFKTLRQLCAPLRSGTTFERVIPVVPIPLFCPISVRPTVRSPLARLPVIQSLLFRLFGPSAPCLWTRRRSMAPRSSGFWRFQSYRRNRHRFACLRLSCLYGLRIQYRPVRFSMVLPPVLAFSFSVMMVSGSAPLVFRAFVGC
ncbi:hypothetical protein BBOMB_0509 [Bifidobacterium bombi DSM 19703]|uniref:Uncharacterized protein n=1 Tax=Bifidobacterium bombi DSM 19703 TaxID=1341695 RepID=A0A080N4A3_9BIFI|nr:hypothetical protein BBOMB_0509 [Bifidobacterium bombi DSM 19703]